MHDATQQSVRRPRQPIQVARPQRPSISATRRAIAAEMVLEATRRYEHAAARSADIIERIRDDDALSACYDLAVGDLDDARSSLISAIVAMRYPDDDLAGSRADRRWWPPCGVTVGGRTYLAAPDPLRDPLARGEGGKDGRLVMGLLILEPGSIADLDDGPAEARPAEMEPGGPKTGPVGPMTAGPMGPSGDVVAPARGGPHRVRTEVTNGDQLLFANNRPMALEDVLRWQLEDDPAEDQAVWRDDRLAAVIRARGDGPPEVIRFD